MPKAYKTLGQVAPAANTDTTLYTVPAGKSAVASTLQFCNRDTSTVAAYRIAVVPSGETLAAKHYLRYDQFLDFRKDEKMTIGFTLAAGDAIVVRSDIASLSFTLFGVENTSN